ncbi:uncharacterized protein LOC116286243 [Actinia tenebrosa]|uniref:Uncharacterized protein LOC116286243 n=1 Tax=Actinia tenebrosa TaxID=6105 RepID=A0A6P8H770_ACTTE|nr:uncharacterized protein LOC116286243 [Actinia tenebrosa]
MEIQDWKKFFLYDNLRVETIRQLDAYIKDGKGTLAELKDRFRTFLSELTVNKRKKIDTVEKFVEALEKQSLIGANDVKLLKVLAEKIGLEELKQKVEKYEADCSGDAIRCLPTMGIQDSKKRFSYDYLRVETIRQLQAYIADGKGTLAELKDCFRGSLPELTENELKEISDVNKLVKVLEEQGVIKVDNVKLLKVLAEKSGLEELKQKVGEYEADNAGIFRRTLNAAKGASGFIWDRFKGTVIHLKTEISVKGVLLTLAGATFIGIYGMDLEKLQYFERLIGLLDRVVALFSGSVVIVLKLSSISSLKRLWQSYKDGSLKEKLKKSLNEEEELKELSQGEEIDVEVTIDEEEYHAVLWNLILLDVKGKSMKNGKSQRRHSVCYERDVSEDRSKPMDVKGKPMKNARIKRRHSVCCERDVPEDMDPKGKSMKFDKSQRRERDVPEDSSKAMDIKAAI